MRSTDPLRSRRRWRQFVPLSLGAAMLGVLLTMGLLRPDVLAGGVADLRTQILSDHSQLTHAVTAYVADTGALPAPSFDLTRGTPNPLQDRQLVPFAQQERWAGPYLGGGLSRPTGASFWSLAEPEVLQWAHDGSAGAACWGRLHRGYGEIDAATAAWLDRTLDDGDGAAGRVRVTDTWLWFLLAPPAAPDAR